MKIFAPSVFLTHIVTITLGSFALSACAATKSNSLPVQMVAGNAGSVSSVRTYEQGGKLYVAGSARPTFTSGGNHVDIQLIGADGGVIAEDTETIRLGHPRGTRRRHGSDSFVTSFPLSTAQTASSVRVTFHSSGH